MWTPDPVDEKTCWIVNEGAMKRNRSKLGALEVKDNLYEHDRKSFALSGNESN